jgi:hypothetical protein
MKSKSRKNHRTVEVNNNPAANGVTYKSFIENNQRFMICRNSVEQGEFWKGQLCGNWVAVSNGATAILCSKCTSKLIPFQEKISVSKSDKPRGWAFMVEYVHTDGTVYHKGVEQPELKGTLEPTQIKVREPKQKLSKKDKLEKKSSIAIELDKAKKELKKETKKTYQNKLRIKINKLQKQLSKL